MAALESCGRFLYFSHLLTLSVVRMIKHAYATYFAAGVDNNFDCASRHKIDNRGICHRQCGRVSYL